ncbi:alpha/beta fold hydrolase [Glutamicibacter sp. NPDC087344]|uniref:alpha/beta fold hydrolase n=1 Tax=Glutamicibacter sp. NPDC087344 TaxID=3363994 RepID=UPI00380BEBCD
MSPLSHTVQQLGSTPRLLETYVAGGRRYRDYVLEVPLDWNAPQGASIQLFYREMVLAHLDRQQLPLMVYLQGGPGGTGPRPVGGSDRLSVALERYRVILMDQRGTGRSTPVTTQVISQFPDGQSGAAYLENFRADSIVADAEAIRTRGYHGRRWATLGQSYGGFLTLTYLSYFDDALSACFITGGLPSLQPSAAGVYDRTIRRVRAKNEQFYRLYPQDRARAAALARTLAEREVLLPDGDQFTVRRLQSLGIDFGMGPGFERLHWLLELSGDGTQLSDALLQEVQSRTNFASNPLFAVLQEDIYGHDSNGASAFAAQTELEQHPDFATNAETLLFSGEMMFRWTFEETRLLRAFIPAVEVLAARSTHRPIYNVEKLASNKVPIAAAVYHDDMYVDAGLSLDTAKKVGSLQAWVTNEYEHDGINDPAVLRRLFSMVDETGGPLEG